MLMRNGKASVDKLSNSCFSFITQQHSAQQHHKSHVKMSLCKIQNYSVLGS